MALNMEMHGKGRSFNLDKESKADVVALQELVDFNAADLEKLAAAFGHPYTAIAKKTGIR